MANGKKDDMHEKNLRYQLYGWILFVACALLFIAAGIVGREPLVFAGSLLFLLACIFFLIPLIDSFRKGKGDS